MPRFICFIDSFHCIRSGEDTTENAVRVHPTHNFVLGLVKQSCIIRSFIDLCVLNTNMHELEISSTMSLLCVELLKEKSAVLICRFISVHTIIWQQRSAQSTDWLFWTCLTANNHHAFSLYGKEQILHFHNSLCCLGNKTSIKWIIMWIIRI